MEITIGNNERRKRKKRILVVDDEPDITYILKTSLDDTGLFKVDTFNDPELALSTFKSGYYDFLLIDIRMPKMSGYELYDKIKDIDGKVKSCFITAYEINYQALREQFPTLEMEGQQIYQIAAKRKKGFTIRSRENRTSRSRI